MPHRHYDFPLPHHFSKWEMQFAPDRLKSVGLWDDLPRYLRLEIMEAYNKGVGYTLTRQDLDNINDDVWERAQDVFFPQSS